jgi:hypothetical protein
VSWTVSTSTIWPQSRRKSSPTASQQLTDDDNNNDSTTKNALAAGRIDVGRTDHHKRGRLQRRTLLVKVLIPPVNFLNSKVARALPYPGLIFLSKAYKNRVINDGRQVLLANAAIEAHLAATLRLLLLGLQQICLNSRAQRTLSEQGKDIWAALTGASPIQRLAASESKSTKWGQNLTIRGH